MKITLRTAMYIADKIKEIERARLENERIRFKVNTIFQKKGELAEYVKKLTDDEWARTKKAV